MPAALVSAFPPVFRLVLWGAAGAGKTALVRRLAEVCGARDRLAALGEGDRAALAALLAQVEPLPTVALQRWRLPVAPAVWAALAREGQGARGKEQGAASGFGLRASDQEGARSTTKPEAWCLKPEGTSGLKPHASSLTPDPAGVLELLELPGGECLGPRGPDRAALRRACARADAVLVVLHPAHEALPAEFSGEAVLPEAPPAARQLAAALDLADWFVEEFECRFLPLVFVTTHADRDAGDAVLAARRARWHETLVDRYRRRLDAQLGPAAPRALGDPALCTAAVGATRAAGGSPGGSPSHHREGEARLLAQLGALRRAHDAAHRHWRRTGRAAAVLAAALLAVFACFAVYVVAQPADEAAPPYIPAPDGPIEAAGADGRAKSRAELAREFESFVRHVDRWTNFHPPVAELSARDLDQYGRYLAWLQQSLARHRAAVDPRTSADAEARLDHLTARLDAGLAARQGNPGQAREYLGAHLETVLDRLAARPPAPGSPGAMNRAPTALGRPDRFPELRAAYLEHWRRLRQLELEARLAALPRRARPVDQYAARLALLEEFLHDARAVGTLAFAPDDARVTEADEARAFCRTMLRRGEPVALTLAIRALSCRGGTWEVLRLALRGSNLYANPEPAVLELRRTRAAEGRRHYVGATAPEFRLPKWAVATRLHFELQEHRGGGQWAALWQLAPDADAAPDDRFAAAPGYELFALQQAPRVLRPEADGDWQVEIAVRGLPEPPALFARLAR